MTTQEATHHTAGTGEETLPFDAAQSPLLLESDSPLILESDSPLLLEDAPPLLLESVPTPFLESTPTPFLENAPTPSPEDAPAPQPALETEARTVSLEYTPPGSSPRADAPDAPARKVNASAPDPFAVGVRLLRMAPVWLLLTTVGCALLVLMLGWVNAGGDAPVAALSSKQNDSRAVKPAPKPSDAPPQTAAATSPEAATKPSDAPPAQSEAPAPQPAQSAPAPVEQPAPAEAPKPAEQAQAERPAQADDAAAKFTVQVGSYNNQSEANEHVSRLRSAGFEARSAAAELPGRGTWYRVQVGRFADRAEASKAVSQLRSKGAASSALVAPLQN